MPPEAYEIGLRPWEYERLTPSQFTATIEAFNRRELRDRRKLAEAVRHLLLPHMKQGATPPSIDSLLGIESDEETFVFTEVG